MILKLSYVFEKIFTVTDRVVTFFFERVIILQRTQKEDDYMTFGEKLKKLRTENHLTQDELAEKLYVTRTAISKWETDKGYPNIESLKAIASFFSITIDELLASEEILVIAEKNQKQTEKVFRDLAFGLLDICMSLLLFLPLFATNIDDGFRETSLLSLDGISLYLKIAYIVIVIVMCITGILMLIIQSLSPTICSKLKGNISLVLGVTAVLLFIVGKQPYAAAFAFSLLVIKAIILLKKV